MIDRIKAWEDIEAQLEEIELDFIEEEMFTMQKMLVKVMDMLNYRIDELRDIVGAEVTFKTKENI